MDDSEDAGGETPVGLPVAGHSDALREAIARERAAGGGRIIWPADEDAYRRAVEGLIAMGGSEPDLVAPPRRRMW